MKYYLINNTIKKGSEMPEINNTLLLRNHKKTINEFEMIYSNWLSSLQPCEISESELDKLSDYLKTLPCGFVSNPIEVTDIISDNNGVITFKEKDSERKITSQKYAAKIVEVAFFERIPNKETICNVVTALIDEYANNKVEEFKVEQAKFLIENFSNKQVDGEIEAVEFLIEQSFKLGFKWGETYGCWFNPNEEDNQRKLKECKETVKQLYEIFKNRK